MRRLTLMLVGTMSMGGAGIFALACSSDPAQVTPGDDDDDDGASSGKASSSSSSGGSGASSGGGGSSTSSGGGSSSGGCFSQLRPSADKGPFCPFLPKSGSSGTGASCDTGETCCVGRSVAGGSGGFDPNLCAASADECPDPTDDTQQKSAYECTETNDCPGGPAPTGDAGTDGGGTGGGSRVCCVIPNPAKDDSTLNLGVGTFSCPILKGDYGTRCRTTCGDRELQGCEADSDCPSDKPTCTLASVGPQNRINMGVCQ